MRLIGLTGYAGSGKSAVASALEKRFGFNRVRFATPLKNMLRALGLTYHELEGDGKQEPCDLLCGKTPRHAMLTLGTEWGRDLIGGDLWVRAWKKEIESYGDLNVKIVAEDVRYHNELAAVESLGGVIWQVSRPGVDRPFWGNHHPSEDGGLSSSFIIENDSGLSNLHSRVDQAYARYNWVAQKNEITSSRCA